MSPGARRFAVLLVLLVAIPAMGRARALSLFDSGDGPDLTRIDLTRGLRLLPTAQLDQASGFLPKGQLGDDPVDWPVALGQFATSAAINVLGAFAFNSIATPGKNWSAKAKKGQLITTTVIQLLTQPLVSATGVYFVGEADSVHDVGFGWPLLTNYVAELVVDALKVGIDLGAASSSDALKQASDLLSAWVAVDYVLHALIPPVATTYMSIRSREPKSIAFSELAPVVPSTRSVADLRSQATLAAAQPMVAGLPLAAGKF